VSELVVEVFEGGVSTGSLESCHCWQTVFVEANPDFLFQKAGGSCCGNPSRYILTATKKKTRQPKPNEIK